MGCFHSKQNSRRQRAVQHPQTNAPANQIPVIDENHPAVQQLWQLEQLLAQHPEWLAQHPEMLGQSATGQSSRMMASLEHTTSFEYTPLEEGEIRLVALHPGQGDAELMCSLMTMRLESGPQLDYEALSYAWGDPKGLHPVRCNNSETLMSEDGQAFQAFPFRSDESIQVSPNLKAALLRLRVEDDFRMLWIDAICIDQTSHTERSAQVQRMSEIYEYAESVLIWLGEEDETTESAFACIDRLNGMKTWLHESFPNPDSASELQAVGFQPWRLDPKSPGFLTSESWLAFRSLMLKSTWFMRAWTWQEVVMATESTIICGGLSKSWDELVEACNVVSDFRIYDADRALAYYNKGENAHLMVEQVVQRGRTRLSKLRAHSANSTPQWIDYFSRVRFESLLAENRIAEATDPRDKVYSVLSIAHSNGVLPKVDYSLNVREVYLQTAKFWIRENQKMGINVGAFLSGVQMANPKHRLPSWVVDWSTPPIAASLALQKHFTASGKSEISFRFVEYMEPTVSGGSFKPTEVAFLDTRLKNATDFFPDKNEKQKPIDLEPSLCARGVVLLTIKAANRRRTLADAPKHLELMSAFADPYPTTSKPYVEIYPRIINPEKRQDYSREPENGTPGFWEYVQKFGNEERKSGQAEVQHDVFGRKSTPPRQIRTQDELKLPELFESIGSMTGPFGMYSRSFFVTTNGFMGLGPNRAAEGDQVCILYGCPCPFVIRPLSTTGRYWLVGECYVFGLMDGEAMNELPQEKVQELIFD